MKGPNLFATCMLVFLAGAAGAGIAVFPAGVAHAYPISGTATEVPTTSLVGLYGSSTEAANATPAWLTQAANWLVQSAGPFTLPTAWTPQGILQWLDLWLYGVAGFHVLSYSNTITSISSWAAGAASGAVKWTQGALQSLRLIR